MEICSNAPHLAYNDGVYHGTTVYSWLIKEEASSLISNEYLLAIGNSKLLWWFLKLTGDTLRGDARRLKSNYLAPFPLPKNPNPLLKEELEELVKKRLSSNPSEHKKLERIIDEKVCEIYGLTDELKDRICNQF